MGQDKTSWLDLNEDDGRTRDLGNASPFTQSIDPASSDPTHAMPGTQAHGASEMRTMVEPGIEKTEIYHPGKVKEFKGAGGFDAMTDPVTGWLVVVKGPGLGQSVPLGAGMNALGRDSDATPPLPFGDMLISGKDHLRILYDDAIRSFFVTPGSGRNISRVDGALVTQTMPLESHAVIELSKQTHVRFVAFCTNSFDWSDLPQDEG
ncbi:MAG: FHA domain-containing protein [Rhodobacteraceae bacterium]|nr:FHA domain-containing protein [Paracoccaceae bacterium]